MSKGPRRPSRRKFCAHLRRIFRPDTRFVLVVGMDWRSGLLPHSFSSTVHWVACQSCVHTNLARHQPLRTAAVPIRYAAPR